MQELGREEAVSFLLTSCVTVAKASEISEVIASPHSLYEDTSGLHSTWTNLLCAVLLRKKEANSTRMQLLVDIRRKGLFLIL